MTTNYTLVNSQQARTFVKEKYYPNPPKQLHIAIDHSDENEYVIHAYENVIDDPKTGAGHTATWGWYYVNKKTGKVTSMFE